jgi:L-threonylcarbamoyladenylate synthase
MSVLDWREIRKAADVIRDGGLVAMPTETVYGLAADATSDLAVARVFEAKGRPRFNPLIVHVLDVAAAEALAVFSPLARRLAEALWPGPLTLVLPRRADCPVSLLASAGLDTIALRSPDHPIARALLSAAQRPLAAPSANASGAISPTRAEHVGDSLGAAVDMILDGGPSAIGVESTIVKVDGENVVVLRPGGLAAHQIETSAGRRILRQRPGERPEAPGMLASHYAPAAALRLDVETPRPDEAFLAFGPTREDRPGVFQLSRAGDLGEAAANLFAHLRAADAACRAAGFTAIAVARIPSVGLGEAINDRLARAAAPRR